MQQENSAKRKGNSMAERERDERMDGRMDARMQTNHRVPGIQKESHLHPSLEEPGVVGGALYSSLGLSLRGGQLKG